jgi:hypothetical protein
VEEGIRQEIVFQNQIIETELNQRTMQELLRVSRLITAICEETFRCFASLVTQ